MRGPEQRSVEPQERLDIFGSRRSRRIPDFLRPAASLRKRGRSPPWASLMHSSFVSGCQTIWPPSLFLTQVVLGA